MAVRFLKHLLKNKLSPKGYIGMSALLSCAGALIIWYALGGSSQPPSSPQISTSVNWETLPPTATEKTPDDTPSQAIETAASTAPPAPEAQGPDQREDQIQSTGKTNLESSTHLSPLQDHPQEQGQEQEHDQAQTHFHDPDPELDIQSVFKDFPLSPSDTETHDQDQNLNQSLQNQDQAEDISPAPPPGKTPKIALVLVGMGLLPDQNVKAVNALSPQISFAFIPYTENLRDVVAQAREKGHEVLMSIPMETMNYPQMDPGPQTLLTGLAPQENIKRLHWALAKADGFVGVCNYLGSRFTAVKNDLKPILKEIQRLGYFFLDTKEANRSQVEEVSKDLHLPVTSSDMAVKMDDTHDTFIHKMEKLIEIAQENGSAVGIIEFTPHRLEQLIEWQNAVEEGTVQLVPLSQLLQKEPQDSPPSLSQHLAEQESASPDPDSAAEPLPEKERIVSELEEDFSPDSPSPAPAQDIPYGTTAT